MREKSDDRYPLSSEAVRRLCNLLRRYAEASVIFPRLFALDREEAIDNLDRAFDAVLEEFHSLSDIMPKECPGLDWYDYGETAACLIVRNARHHNVGGLFPSWNRRFALNGPPIGLDGATLLMVSFSAVEDVLFVSKYFLPLAHFDRRLRMANSRIPRPAQVMATLDGECGFAAIRRYAALHRFPEDQVYVNIIPIVANAAARVLRLLRERGLIPSGFDVETYAPHFQEFRFDLTAPEFHHLLVLAKS